MKQPDPTQRALGELVKELPFAYFRLRAAGDELAARAGQTTGKWGLMRSLAEDGPLTVAQLARSRPVARQWVQRLANELGGAGLIEFIDNPNHRRSKLMRLTGKGERVLGRMQASLESWAARLSGGFDERAVRTTVRTLRQLRARLPGGA
jgi:DNA-binding MarR family transcriptional regulator